MNPPNKAGRSKLLPPIKFRNYFKMHLTYIYHHRTPPQPPTEEPTQLVPFNFGK